MLTTTEEIKGEEQSIQEALNEWLSALVQITAAGEPFFHEGKFAFSFGNEKDIFKISISKEPNNIIQFPAKTKTPKRI